MFIHTEICGTGEPLVLIHGWAMHSGIWHTFAKQLAQHYQVICVDLPGHGRSAKLPEFTLEAISKHLQKILPVTSCTLIGWSLGGTVALDLTNRFPKQIKRLILIGSNPCFVATPTWAGIKPVTLEKFAADLVLDYRGTLLRFLSLQINGLQDFKSLLKDLKNILQTCESPDTDVLQGGLKILERHDLRLQLAHLNCPVQVILGSHDTLVPVAIAESIQQLNPRVKLTIIDKAAHVPFLTHSEQLIEVLITFMETRNFV